LYSPSSDLSNENIKYLTVNQSLADLAHFILTIKENYEGLSNSKVVIVGGSYSATMVTWFRRLYPDLVVGGWASSAPLFAKVNFVGGSKFVQRTLLVWKIMFISCRIQRNHWSIHHTDGWR